jgi:hypothetical protein
LGKQTFAGLPPCLEFGLNAGKREFGKMQFEGFQHADQNRSSLSTAKSFAGATGSSILSGIAK